MSALNVYRLAALATVACYAVMAGAALRRGSAREAVVAALFAASNAVIFWR